MVIYPLLNKYKKKLNNWIIHKDRVLFIHGKEGTGKSTLANHLLKDYERRIRNGVKVNYYHTLNEKRLWNSKKKVILIEGFVSL